MAYWIYQHLGNLSPAELAEDETYPGALRRGRRRRPRPADGHDADEQTGHSRFSFCRDLGPARLIMLDSRAGRQLEPGNRRDHERRGVGVGDRQGRRRPPPPADGELAALPAARPGCTTSRAGRRRVTDGAWGKRLTRPGREGPDRRQPRPLGVLPRELRQVRGSRRRHRHGQAAASRRTRCCSSAATSTIAGSPRSGCPRTRGESGTKIWQTVCSGLRKDLQASERIVLQLGHTRLAGIVGWLLARSAGLGPPRLRWRPVTRPHFRNQAGTLEIAGGEVGVRIERVSGGWRKPRLNTVIEHKLV